MKKIYTYKIAAYFYFFFGCITACPLYALSIKTSSVTVEIQCVKIRREQAYLIKAQTSEPFETIVDSVTANNNGLYMFRLQPEPSFQYWIRIGSNTVRYSVCLANNDSLVFTEDTIKKSFELTYDRIGANQKQEQIRLTAFDSISGVLVDDTTRSAFIKYMEYTNKIALQHLTDVTKFTSQFPEHIWFTKFFSEGMKYFVPYAQSVYIVYHLQESDIMRYDNYDPTWADTVSVKTPQYAMYSQNFSGFVNNIITIRLKHWNRRGIDTVGADPRRLKQMLKIILNSLDGLSRDGMIQSTAMDADIDYDANLSIPIIEEELDSLRSKNGNRVIIEEVKKRLDAIKERQAGHTAKDLTLPDINGNMLSLSEFRGKAIFIHFWGTWCGPCKEQLPRVLEFEKEYVHDTNLIIIGIALEYHNFDKWKKFVLDKKMSWIQLYAEGTFQSIPSKTYSLNWVPAYMLLDREGRFISSREEPPPNDKLEADIILAKRMKQ